jgi:hypothetical protein
MNDIVWLKKKKQLINELKELRQQVDALEMLRDKQA